MDSGDKILLNLTPVTADIDDISDYQTAKHLLNSGVYSSLKEALGKRQL